MISGTGQLPKEVGEDAQKEGLVAHAVGGRMYRGRVMVVREEVGKVFLAQGSPTGPTNPAVASDMTPVNDYLKRELKLTLALLTFKTLSPGKKHQSLIVNNF